MQFFSTRNHAHTVSSAQAIVNGLAPDGGLYLPTTFPAFPMNELSHMTGEDISVRVLSSLFDDFSEEQIRRAVRAAYTDAFENGNIAPLVPVSDGYISELWHGPTCAFKDVALCLLPHLLTMAARSLDVTDTICILTATSGDTGSAALSGFTDVDGTGIIVFYPDGGVSPMQKRQMVTNEGKNTAVCAVHGNFDDAQSGVKAVFASDLHIPGVRFSSANSINIGRLAPQIAYYFQNYRDLMNRGVIALGDPVNFVVPTGNFGDILAGYFAARMGLPVGRLVCASNENRVLTDFFATGVYDRRREFHLTASPSMDILISSNLERLLALTVGDTKTAELMRDLKENGAYTLPADALSDMRRVFSAGWATDEACAEVIRRVFERDGYLMDTHTAVAYSVYEAWKASEEGNGAPTVILSTASPYKFVSSVLRALGHTPTEDGFRDMQALSDISGMPIPHGLAKLRTATVHHTDITEPSEMQTYVAKIAATLGGRTNV